MRRPATFALACASALLTAATSAAANAQAPPPPPTAACTDSGYRQFDFWLGEWEVFTPDGKRAGVNSIRRVHGGCVLEESWHGASGSTGSSFNIYTPSTNQWHQTWVDSDGLLLRLDGSFDGAMRLAGETTGRDGVRTSHRLTWTPQDGGRLRQLWESSADGKPWTVVFDGTYVRKRGAPSS
jgi:hypothetical protein